MNGRFNIIQDRMLFMYNLISQDGAVCNEETTLGQQQLRCLGQVRDRSQHHFKFKVNVWIKQPSAQITTQQGGKIQKQTFRIISRTQ